jgi:glutamate dehydrogenase (NADP+)
MKSVSGTVKITDNPLNQEKMNAYIAKIIGKLEFTIPWEEEFIQAVKKVFVSVEPIIEKTPHYQKHRILERLVVPERTIMFRVPWLDDAGDIQINNGYRIEFNSVLGPYKGGLRFHESTSLNSLKFLGFEQIFKNALTGLPLGAGKGGSDFSTKGKSDMEVMRFCQSFMTELFRHIGSDTDILAGDIGVGGREIGYLYGQYKKLKNETAGVFTGKGLNWGGSLLRMEATGFGNVYFADEMLKTKQNAIEGKNVAISGFGNVAWGSARKVNDLGGKVVTLSGADGYVYDPDGIKGEKIDFMLKMRGYGNDLVKEYADHFGVAYFPGKKPWEVKVDIALPCAFQNELDDTDAKNLINNGCICVSEGANMPCTPEAVELFLENNILFGPGKAANAGGVATSGLEMTQNSLMLGGWSKEAVDEKLNTIMKNIHKTVKDAADEFGVPGNYVIGANIAGFKRVADSMISHGLV